MRMKGEKKGKREVRAAILIKQKRYILGHVTIPNMPGRSSGTWMSG